MTIKCYEVWKDRFEVKAPVVGDKWTVEKMKDNAIMNGLNGEQIDVFENINEAKKCFEQHKKECSNRIFYYAGMRFLNYDYLYIVEVEYEADDVCMEPVQELGIVDDYVEEIKGD